MTDPWDGKLSSIQSLTLSSLCLTIKYTTARTGDEGMPALVDALVNEIIIGVACGDGQTLALTSTGEVYGWGCYKDKEGNKWFNPSSNNNLSWQDICKQQNQPQLIHGLANIVDIACGSSFNLARADDGQLYSWGIGECGELGREVVEVKAGRGAGDEKLLRPICDTLITPGPMFLLQGKVKLDNVKAIGCGSYHALVVTADGKVYSAGLNNYGQLGLGHTDNQSFLCEVTSISSSSIKSVKGGMHHSLALTSDGTMLAWGRSDSSQLGIKDSSSSAGSYQATPVMPVLPPEVKVQEISCGGNHNLALAYIKSEPRPVVYTWGYGDMSALGHGKDQDEPVPRRIDFAKGAKIANIMVTQVAGGGQHSAIIGQVLST
jgi:regulator of chromosome condensation